MLKKRLKPRFQPFLLIPIDIAAIISLIPFERIGKHLRCCAETEIERGIGAQHNTTGHLKAVQIARNIHGGGSKFLILEIISRGKINSPIIGNGYITREVYILGISVWIAHILYIYRARPVLGHNYTIGNRKTPRYFEGHISIGVHIGILRFTL